MISAGRALAWLALVGALALLAACGAQGGAPEGAGFSHEVTAQQFTVTATGSLTWDPNHLTSQAGEVTFVVKNPTTLVHNFVLQGNGVNATSGDLRPGTTTNLTLKGLKPGAYRYVCTIPGHASTMNGTLTVK
ncbi:MAG TPA: plastocyanin/azurin family copper-binding protein [Thermomicrobiales bacterium]|nr:plastocyanin/azurin family copper-binding protein [Thermomicrobiales bacterium]